MCTVFTPEGEHVHFSIRAANIPMCPISLSFEKGPVPSLFLASEQLRPEELRLREKTETCRETMFKTSFGVCMYFLDLVHHRGMHHSGYKPWVDMFRCLLSGRGGNTKALPRMTIRESHHKKKKKKKKKNSTGPLWCRTQSHSLGLTPAEAGVVSYSYMSLHRLSAIAVVIFRRFKGSPLAVRKCPTTPSQ